MAALVTVNYGSSALLEQNLASMAKTTEVLVVVVDNFSTPAERDAVTALCWREGWRLLASDANPGFGAAINAGVAAAAAAGANRFVIVNPDASLPPDDLRRLIRACDVPGVLAAPIVLRPDGSIWSAGGDLYLSDGRIRSVGRRGEAPGEERILWLSGACLAFSAEVWAVLGGFSDDYFLYWEDVDLSYRALREGLILRVVEDAVVIHAEGGTQQAGLARSGQAKSGTYYRYNVRNRLLFGARFMEERRWRSWLRHTPKVSWEILLQGGRRQFLHRPQVLLSAGRGLLEGLVLAGRERARRRGSSC